MQPPTDELYQPHVAESCVETLERLLVMDLRRWVVPSNAIS